MVNDSVADAALIAYPVSKLFNGVDASKVPGDVTIPKTAGDLGLNFIKYHGLGNDFAMFIGGMSGLVSPTPATVVALCHRGKGIGADGVMLARPSTIAAVRMELINSDGSIPEMCGNGLRCFVKYVVEELGMTANPLPVETVGGVRRCFYTLRADGSVESVRVDMGKPTFLASEVPVELNGSAETEDGDEEVEALRVPVSAHGEEFVATGVNTGNPHMVIFHSADRAFAEHYGPPLERHASWPHKANVEFVEVLAPDHLRVVVWERGCGLTQACGTGATASVAAACRLGHCAVGTPVRVDLLGGPLTITVEEGFHTAWMEGPAVEAYRASMSARSWA